MKAEIGTDIDKAAQLLKEGQVVAIPTETVYGLAANCFDIRAVSTVFEVKRRPNFDPLIVHIASAAIMDELARAIPLAARELAAAFWPGPLTLVLPKREIVPYDVTAGLDTVALRMPNHPMTLSLLSKLQFSLAAPSANPFGYISPTTAWHVMQQLGYMIPYILDGGPAEIGIESTIIGFDVDAPVILRYGIITQSDIEKVVGKVKSRVHTSANPQAPGMLDSHYAPKTRLCLIQANEEIPDGYVAYLGFQQWHPTIDRNHQILLSQTGNIYEAARNLYAALRQLDEDGFECIYVSLITDASGEAQAINDRITRAAQNLPAN